MLKFSFLVTQAPPVYTKSAIPAYQQVQPSYQQNYQAKLRVSQTHLINVLITKINSDSCIKAPSYQAYDKPANDRPMYDRPSYTQYGNRFCLKLQ